MTKEQLRRAMKVMESMRDASASKKFEVKEREVESGPVQPGSMVMVTIKPDRMFAVQEMLVEGDVELFEVVGFLFNHESILVSTGPIPLTVFHLSPLHFPLCLPGHTVELRARNVGGRPASFKVTYRGLTEVPNVAVLGSPVPHCPGCCDSMACEGCPLPREAHCGDTQDDVP